MRQAGALPYRLKGEGPDSAVEILLVTSRQTQRWIIPKGNIDYLMSPHAAAAQEAMEEAGAVGGIGTSALGAFHYRKLLRQGGPVTAKVTVFPLQVATLMDDWPEKGLRERRWFSREEAVVAVQEPELKDIIRHFQPGGGS